MQNTITLDNPLPNGPFVYDKNILFYNIKERRRRPHITNIIIDREHKLKLTILPMTFLETIIAEDNHCR